MSTHVPAPDTPAFRRDNRYDLWKCARCGRVLTIQSVPHRSPTCCGTGMWFQELKLGASYLVELGRDA